VAKVPKNETDERLGRRISELRTLKNMSPELVAESARMSTEDYLKGESGEHRFGARELYYIARTLGVSMEEIFGALE